MGTGGGKGSYTTRVLGAGPRAREVEVEVLPAVQLFSGLGALSVTSAEVVVVHRCFQGAVGVGWGLGFWLPCQPAPPAPPLGCNVHDGPAQARRQARRPCSSSPPTHHTHFPKPWHASSPCRPPPSPPGRAAVVCGAVHVCRLARLHVCDLQHRPVLLLLALRVRGQPDSAGGGRHAAARGQRGGGHGGWEGWPWGFWGGGYDVEGGRTLNYFARSAGSRGTSSIAWRSAALWSVLPVLQPPILFVKARGWQPVAASHVMWYQANGFAQ